MKPNFLSNLTGNPVYQRNRSYLLLLLSALLGLSGCATLPVSDHFDGSRFYNPASDSSEHGFADHVKWMWEMKTVDWPEWIQDTPQPAPPARVGTGQLRITYINQATLLIQTDSLNILTDPIFSDFAGPVSFLASKRIRNPGIPFDSLPSIDIVLVSHNHYDHFDLPTLVRIGKRDRPVLITGLGNKDLIDTTLFSKVYETDWWQDVETETGRMKITFVPALHQSGRGLFDENESVWGGFVLESSFGRVYFAGDTGYGQFVQPLHQRFPDFRLTILPIGSYEKRWIMKSQHMNPDDAVRLHLFLQSKQSIGMHFATFLEHPEQNVDQHEKDLEAALKTYKVDRDQFLILKFGEGVVFH
ncbi:MAG: MBL fold metallo-hydrolase [Bacteroidetes bacterium]|nr:MBL fold metallo-hydrolase [Bacteroidota bacterium]